MKYISIKICLVIVALFGGVSVAVASDLPDCPNNVNFRHNCFGTFTSHRGKYVGEWQDDKQHGQGIYTWGEEGIGAGVLQQEGIWKDGKFLETRTIAEFETMLALKLIAKKEKYERIYNACLLDKGSDVDMQVSSLERAVKQTCKSIAKKPSWLENFRYD